MSTIITGSQIPYSMVPLALIRNPDISPEAKGIYAYLLSYASIPDWQLVPVKIRRDNRIGEKRYLRIMRELKEAGWIIYHVQPELPKGWKTTIQVLYVARTDGISTIYYDARGIPTGRNNVNYRVREGEACDEEAYYSG